MGATFLLRPAPRFCSALYNPVPTSVFRLPYYCIRRISSPEDIECRRDVYAGQARIESFRGLPTDENVRQYLLDAEGKKRRRPTQVHKAIRDTLENAPENFSPLNSGIVIVAREATIDEKNKFALLKKPSIINGSQTQGVIRDFLEEQKGLGKKLFDTHCKFELLVTDDDDLIGEVSIARNFQNDVMTISIAGRLGQLDELEKSFRREVPGTLLRKSETDLSQDYVFTEKLLQVITALIPAELWANEPERGNPNKVFTYSMKAKCLKDFQAVWKAVHEGTSEEKKKFKELYQFYLDIAAESWALYEKWKCHEKFYGTRIHSIEREGRTIVDVSDGIVFPILASLSAFAVKRDGKWTISPPDSFSDSELIRAAVNVYKEIANSNPWIMGKSKACYSALYQITSIYRKLSKM